MSWVVFSYSLPSRTASNLRVTLWRRLQQIGAVAPKAGVYVLPLRDECLEAFQWLAQEVQQAQGEAVVMRVERFEGLSDSELMSLFQAVCRTKYAKLEPEAARLEHAMESTKRAGHRRDRPLETLKRLRQRYAEIARVDFFESPEGAAVAARLRRIQESLLQGHASMISIPNVSVSDYHDAVWVTRPRPHVDRLACAWLIRRFINPAARIHYRAQPAPGEVSFDMRQADFGHRGSLCTFETMLASFGLKDPALQAMAEIVHEIDLRDGRFARPETPGIDMLLKGWLLESVSDEELERRGIGLFEGLYTVFTRKPRLSQR